MAHFRNANWGLYKNVLFNKNGRPVKIVYRKLYNIYSQHNCLYQSTSNDLCNCRSQNNIDLVRSLVDVHNKLGLVKPQYGLLYESILH